MAGWVCGGHKVLTVVYILPQISQPLQLLVRLPAVSIECHPLCHNIHNDLFQSRSVSLVPFTKSEENVSGLAKNPLKKISQSEVPDAPV